MRISSVFYAMVVVTSALAAFGVTAEPVPHNHDHAEASTSKHGEVSTPTAQQAQAPHELQIQVKGIVCSFCAHGLEKGLSKLDGLDRDRHGNGVLVDVESQIVTLSFHRGEIWPFSEIHKRIVKAGYDPVRFDFRISGELEESPAGWQLASADPSMLFAVSTETSDSHVFEPGDTEDLFVTLQAEAAKTLEPGEIVPVAIHVAR